MSTYQANPTAPAALRPRRSRRTATAPAHAAGDLRATDRTWGPRRTVTRLATFALLLALPVLALTVTGAAPLRPELIAAAALAACAAWLTFDGLGPVERGEAAWAAWIAVSAVVSGVTLAAGAAVASEPLTVGGLILAATSTSAALLGCTWMRRAESRYLARTRRVFLIGSAAQVDDVSVEIDRVGDIRVAGTWITDRPDLHVVDPEALAERVQSTDPTVLVLSEEAMRDEQLVRAASLVNLAGIKVRPLRTFYEQLFGKVPASELSPAWFLFDVAEIHRRRLYGTVKRTAETLFAAMLLLAVLPAFPIIALAIRRSSAGPIFFSQERVGRAGEVFCLVKFRTMHCDPEREQGTWAAANTSRIFRTGAFLRSTRLDELPQLWNVIRGDLSIVGPRPEQPSIVDRLRHEVPFYAARQTVRPGLTGWAQVQFGYGGSVAGTITKLQFDLYYVKRQSLWLDMRILAATTRTMLRASGN